MADDIRIVEVGPRDGLQNECVPISTGAKLRFIGALAEAGLREIEATSFVSPKWVPQLADAAELWPQLPDGPHYSALIPNLRGMERALALGVDRIAVFTATSDSFTRKNINMTVEQSLEVFAEVVVAFRNQHPTGWVRGYVSTAFECPYEGRIDPKRTVEIASRLNDLEVDEISVGDTIGVAAPIEVKVLTKMLEDALPIDKIGYHFHDTHGTAIANVAAAMELGIKCFDASAGGLGGCPYAPGAGGNLATEDLIYFLQRNAVPTSVDLARLARATLEILDQMGRQPSGKSQLAQLSAFETSPR